MSRLSLHEGCPIGKWLFLLCGSAALSLFVSTLYFHEPRALAQGPNSYRLVPVVFHSPAPTVPPIPKKYPAEPKADTVNGIIDQKESFLRATVANIDERLELNHLYQDNMDDLTAGVSTEGLNDLQQHVIQTEPLIRRLKRDKANNLHKIALLAVTADNLERRIIQLKMQVTRELQPDPTRLLALKKQLETGVNTMLHRIDRDDPLPGLDLDQIAEFRAKMQSKIEVEEGKVLNRAADQGASASDWEDSEYDRYLRHQTSDLPAELRDELLSSPGWADQINHPTEK